VRKALMLGGGDNAKWLFRKLEEVQSDVIVIGMSGEKHWLQSERNVVGFVSASNIRGVISNLSVHKIDQVSFFGKPFSSLLWHDIPRLSTIIVGAVAKSKFKHPTKALPNVYFSTLDARLEKRAVPTFNIGELIPGAQALSGTVLGVEPKHDLLDVYKAALEHRKHKGLIWRKHGMLVLRNGQIFSEVAGTKTFLKDQADIQDLKGAVLVKAEEICRILANMRSQWECQFSLSSVLCR